MLGVPLIGAARKSTPHLSAAARVRADASSETVEQLTMTEGRLSAESNPPGPATTSMTSLEPVTVKKTTSASRDGIESATFAPWAARGSVLDLVRFQTVSCTPPSIRRLDIADPIAPTPIQPTAVSI
jgi:hypothetical protein